MKRGEIWWINFEPSVGGEIRKKRPAIVISNNASNNALNRIQVVPLTSQTGHIYPSEAEIMVNGKKNKAMADQLTTVSKSRLINLEGRISKSDMKKLEKAVKIQLGLFK